MIKNSLMPSHKLWLESPIYNNHDLLTSRKNLFNKMTNYPLANKYILLLASSYCSMSKTSIKYNYNHNTDTVQIFFMAKVMIIL